MIGQFVTSKAGHDKDVLYVVVAQDAEFVFLSDGRLKPINKPKRKRRKHIQPISQRAGEELIGAIQNGSVTNEQIKYAIKQQCKQNQ